RDRVRHRLRHDAGESVMQETSAPPTPSPFLIPTEVSSLTDQLIRTHARLRQRYQLTVTELRNVRDTLDHEIERIETQNASVRALEQIVPLATEPYQSLVIANHDSDMLIDRVHSRLADHARAKQKDPSALAAIDDSAIR